MKVISIMNLIEESWTKLCHILNKMITSDMIPSTFGIRTFGNLRFENCS